MGSNPLTPDKSSPGPDVHQVYEVGLMFGNLLQTGALFTMVHIYANPNGNRISGNSNPTNYWYHCEYDVLNEKITKTRNAFCGTWYLPHSHVHNERTVPISMARCIAHARNGRISTYSLKSDVTIVFLDSDFL